MCFVVAGGFHATMSDALLGTYLRPDNLNGSRPNTLEEFRKVCFAEEVEQLNYLREQYNGLGLKKRNTYIVNNS